MNEQQRMQYLEALGVNMFTPRWILPGAQASRQCVLPVAVAGESANSPPATLSGRPEKPVGALVDSLLEDTTPQAAPVEPVTQLVQAQPQSGKAAFSLAFWRIHAQVMVVDSRQPKVLPTEALLQAILSPNGFTKTLPRAEIQNWPVPGRSDQSWQAAHEMIQAFLESRLLSDPIRYLVVMGQDAAQAILGEAPPLSEASVKSVGRVSLDSFACDAIMVPSLTDLLLEPKRKAHLWRLLKPLRQLADE